MLRIGVFARLGEVSVRTLRFYDEKGLIKPARIDAQTGYRYYDTAQIPRIAKIRELRDLGFSLDEIYDALKKPLAPVQFSVLLTAKRDEVCRRLQQDTLTLARIEAYLTDLPTKGNTMDTINEVAVKTVPPVLVASMRATIPNWNSVGATFGRLFGEVYAYVMEQGGAITGPAFDLWLDEEMKDADMAVEACYPVAAALATVGEAHTYELPGATVAWTTHRGAFDAGLTAAHRSVVEWISNNGYRIAGAGREVYLAYNPTGDPAQWVTEIQYPISPLTA